MGKHNAGAVTPNHQMASDFISKVIVHLATLGEGAEFVAETQGFDGRSAHLKMADGAIVSFRLDAPRERGARWCIAVGRYDNGYGANRTPAYQRSIGDPSKLDVPAIAEAAIKMANCRRAEVLSSAACARVQDLLPGDCLLGVDTDGRGGILLSIDKVPVTEQQAVVMANAARDCGLIATKKGADS